MNGSTKQIEWAQEIKAEIEAAIEGYIMSKAAKGTPRQRAGRVRSVAPFTNDSLFS